MRPRMRREDRRVVAVLGFLHGVVHANILSIPVFLLAWKTEFGADDVTLGLLAAAGYGLYGIGAVLFGFLADRRAPARLLLLCAAGVAISMVGVAASPSIPLLAVSLGSLGLFSGIYHPTGLSIISRVVAEQGRGMGWHGMGGSLGIAAGPAFVGAMLAIGWSWRSVAALLVIPSLVALLLLFVARLPVDRGAAFRVPPVLARAPSEHPRYGRSAWAPSRPRLRFHVLERLRYRIARGGACGMAHREPCERHPVPGPGRLPRGFRDGVPRHW